MKESRTWTNSTNVVLDYIIREYLEEGDDREITETTPLISGGIVDSFSMVSLKRFLEKKYAIQIPDADATPEPSTPCRGSWRWCGGSKQLPAAPEVGRSCRSGPWAHNFSMRGKSWPSSIQFATATRPTSRRSKRRAVQGRALSSTRPKVGDRGGVPGRRADQEVHQPLRQQLPRALQPPGRGRGGPRRAGQRAATGCRRCASSAARRTSTASWRAG